jgi:DNA gyrase subunit B
MPDLVANGHLYIAQPPLFRVQKGKKGIYLKDQRAYEEFLIAAGAENLEVAGAESMRTIKGQRLITFAHKILQYEKLLQQMERKNQVREMVEAMLKSPRFEVRALKEKQILLSILNDAKSMITSEHPELAPVEFDLGMDFEHDCFKITIYSQENGRRRRTHIDQEFLSSPEFEEVKKLAKDIRATAIPPFRFERNGDAQSARTYGELIEQIFAMGKKGLTIQRYKGLGEMNPEQLWETTMNPETRTLLQVKIDDEVESDLIFTVLMGDQVEPRREFIYENALEVSNLDI